MENQQITKKDENTINVVKSVPVSFDFTPEYLTEQRQRILDQKDRDSAQRDVEVAEIDEYLSQCKQLGIAAKPVEEIQPAGLAGVI
jgi:hypothetical protein